MIITIARNMKHSLSSKDAQTSLTNVEERFRSGDKSLAGTSMARLTTMKYDGAKGMQEHILEMTNIAAKLETQGMKVDESFIVQFILISLLPQYGPFQMHYNSMEDKQNVNDLASMMVQEEAKLKQPGAFFFFFFNNFVSQDAGKKKHHYGKGTKQKPLKGKRPAKGKQVQGNDVTCHFFWKPGYMKAECSKRKTWFEKKGKLCAYVCFESNLVNVPTNSWWLDLGANVHVSITMQGYTFQADN